MLRRCESLRLDRIVATDTHSLTLRARASARACGTQSISLAGAFFPDKDAGRSYGGKTQQRQTGLVSRVPLPKKRNKNKKQSTTGTRRQKAHWYRRWHPGGSCTHHVTRSRLQWKGTLSGEAGVWWCVFHPAGKRWVKKGEEEGGEKLVVFLRIITFDDCCFILAGCFNLSLRLFPLFGETREGKLSTWEFM